MAVHLFRCFLLPPLILFTFFLSARADQDNFLHWYPDIYYYLERNEFLAFHNTIDFSSLGYVKKTGTIHVVLDPYPVKKDKCAGLGGFICGDSGDFFLFNIIYEINEQRHERLITKDTQKVVVDAFELLPNTPFNVFHFKNISGGNSFQSPDFSQDSGQAIGVFGDKRNTLYFYRFSYYSLANQDTAYFALQHLGNYRLQATSPSQTITNIFPQKLDTIPSGQADTLCLIGTDGLLRMLFVEENLLIHEKNLDLQPPETPLYYHDNYLCTDQGKIYRYYPESQSFTLDTLLGNYSIHFIRRDVAIGGQGRCIVRQPDSTWKVYQLENALRNYQYGYFNNNHEGYTADLIDTSWQYSHYVFQDSLTYINTTSPDSLITFINNDCYQYNGSSVDTLIIETADSEGNNRVPILWIKTGSAVHPFNLSNLLCMKYPGADGYIRLASPVHTIILTDDTITYKPNVEEYSTRWPLGWHPLPSFSKSLPWSYNDTFFLILNQDTLRVHHQIPTKNGIPQSLLQKVNSLRINQHNNHLLITDLVSAFEKVQVYTVNGSLLKELTIINKQPLMISALPATQLYIIRLTGTSQTYQMTYLPLKTNSVKSTR